MHQNFQPFRLQPLDVSRRRFDTLPFSSSGLPRQLPQNGSFEGPGFAIP